MVYVEFMKNILLADYCWLLDSCQKTLDYYFLDMMYVEFKTNFLLADSSELMAIRIILAC